jgi:hypothetical protein
MVEPLSIAASVVGVTAAAFKVTFTLYALAEKVATANERIKSIADDLTGTCGILTQIKDLLDPRPDSGGRYLTILNPNALRDIAYALEHCKSIFEQIRKSSRKASEQLKNVASPKGKKIELSKREKAKWPFLQPRFNELRMDLRDSKTNLLLMVAVANLAMANTRGSGRTLAKNERTEIKRVIATLERRSIGDMQFREGEEIHNDEAGKEDTALRRFLNRFGGTATGKGKDGGSSRSLEGKRKSEQPEKEGKKQVTDVDEAAENKMQPQGTQESKSKDDTDRDRDESGGTAKKDDSNTQTTTGPSARIDGQSISVTPSKGSGVSNTGSDGDITELFERNASAKIKIVENTNPEKSISLNGKKIQPPMQPPRLVKDVLSNRYNPGLFSARRPIIR